MYGFVWVWAHALWFSALQLLINARCHISLFGMHKLYAGKQEVRRRLLDDTDFDDNAISPHIIFDLEDTSEKFTDSLRTLSQVNQK